MNVRRSSIRPFHGPGRLRSPLCLRPLAPLAGEAGGGGVFGRLASLEASESLKTQSSREIFGHTTPATASENTNQVHSGPSSSLPLSTFSGIRLGSRGAERDAALNGASGFGLLGIMAFRVQACTLQHLWGPFLRPVTPDLQPKLKPDGPASASRGASDTDDHKPSVTVVRGQRERSQEVKENPRSDRNDMGASPFSGFRVVRLIQGPQIYDANAMLISPSASLSPSIHRRRAVISPPPPSSLRPPHPLHQSSRLSPATLSPPPFRSIPSSLPEHGTPALPLQISLFSCGERRVCRLLVL